MLCSYIGGKNWQEADLEQFKDSMGEMEVPKNAYYAAQTARAIDNFPVSGVGLPKEFIKAMALIKLSAAEANMSLGLLPKNLGRAITRAAKEVAEGILDETFCSRYFSDGFRHFYKHEYK